MVYPGTEAYRQALRDETLLTEDYRRWLTREGLHRTVLGPPGLDSDVLFAWCDQARRSLYLRPQYIAAKMGQVLTRPAEAGRIVRAARVFAGYLFRPVRSSTSGGQVRTG